MGRYSWIPGADAIAALDPTSDKSLEERLGMVGGDAVQLMTGGGYDPYSGGGYLQNLTGNPDALTVRDGISGITSGLKQITDPSTQTATQEPWGPQQQYLKDLFSESKKLYDEGGQLYPDFSPETEDFFNRLIERSGGSPLEDQGKQTLSELMYGDPMLRKTAEGGFLGNNPYLKQQYEQGAQDITDWFNKATQGVQSEYSKSGMTGPSSFEIMRQGQNAQGLSRGLSDLYTGIYAPAYENERNRMVQASGLLGGQRLGAAGQVLPYSQQDIRNIGLLGMVGEARDTLRRQRARAPWEMLGLYGGNVTGNYGGTTTQPGPSDLDRILGYASMGLGAYGATGGM